MPVKILANYPPGPETDKLISQVLNVFIPARKQCQAADKGFTEADERLLLWYDCIEEMEFPDDYQYDLLLAEHLTIVYYDKYDPFEEPDLYEPQRVRDLLVRYVKGYLRTYIDKQFVGKPLPQEQEEEEEE